MDLAPDFKELLEELGRAKANFVVVGGYAVAFHGRPRSTKDIDLVLEGSPENLARAASAVAHFGGPEDVVRALRTLGPHEIAYFGQPPLRIDFLRTIDGVDVDALFAHAITATLDGVSMKVISLDDLIANKRAVGRPQDLVDAGHLEKVRAKI